MRARRTLLSGLPIAALALAVLVGAAHAATLKTLYSFGATDRDGHYPLAGLTVGADGALYGTTQSGGKAIADCSEGGGGTVFKLTPPQTAGDAWTESVLYRFTAGASDGACPVAGLIVDAEGALYGTTVNGGSNACDAETCGTVFKLTPDTGGKYTESILHFFAGGPTDGAFPRGGLVMDSRGALYGTTFAGGASNQGTVFKLTPAAGGTYTETLLYSFAGDADGDLPNAGLITGFSGGLYGTTQDGGIGGYGTVFKLTPGAAGAYKERVLHSFVDGVDGILPMAPLLRGSHGALYGTTETGGTTADGSGTVFELIPGPEGAYTERILHTFNGPDGAQPAAGLVLSRGSLYGTTSAGGSFNEGVVFRVSSKGESVLYSFAGSHGQFPYAGLVSTAPGVFYGTTYSGGIYNYGTVFQLLK